MKVGIIGLGNIGRGLALNVLKHGFPLIVYDVVEEKVKAITELGARAGKNPKEITANSDIVLLSLPAPEVSEKVVLGDEGLLAGAREGLVIVEMSTVHPQNVIKLAEQARQHGVMVVDAPVMGGRVGAETGTLHILFGGEKGVLEYCRPVLKCLSRKITHVGRLGSAQAVKLINNVVSITNEVGALEAPNFSCQRI